MDIKGGIFDLDGTLFDSMPIWENIGYKYIAKKGFVAEKIDNYIFKNLSLHQSALYFKNKFGVDQSVEEIIKEVSDMAYSFYVNDAAPREGVIDFLDCMKASGAKMVVATATEMELAQAILEVNGMMHYFEGILTCTQIGHGKDESIIYDMGLEMIGTDKSKTYVFEDALNPAKTAKAAGYKVVGIFDESEPNTAELEKIADEYINDYYELEWFNESLLIGSSC